MKEQTMSHDDLQRAVRDIRAARTFDEAVDVARLLFLASPLPASAAGRAPASPDDVMDVYVPGRWRCPKCEFQLSSATLFMGSGEIGCTRDQVMNMTGECCPNDGTPMGRVTWREEADANRKWGTDLMEEIISLTGAQHLPGAIEAIRTLGKAEPAPSLDPPRCQYHRGRNYQSCGYCGRPLTEHITTELVRDSEAAETLDPHAQTDETTT